MTMLRLKNLGKRYARADTPSLTGFDLTVERGELVGIVGESGSGKTTILRLVAGFEEPTTGSIAVDGQVVSSGNNFVPAEARGIGMVFQDYALFPHLRIGENIAFGLKGNNGSTRSVVAEMLELVDLQGSENYYPHELSGGQQQRIALARALAPRPKLMLLDEPFSNLDEASKTRVRDDMYRAVQRARITALWVSHDIKQIMSVVKHVTLIKSGRLQQAGEPEQLYREPCNRYVAGFFGKVNILPVHVVNQGLDHPIAEATAGEVGASGEIPEVVIRPDHIDLVEEAEASIVGVVKHTFFQGEKREVVVCAGEHEITVNVGRERIVSVGERLFLRPKCSELRLIRALSHKVR